MLAKILSIAFLTTATTVQAHEQEIVGVVPYENGEWQGASHCQGKSYATSIQLQFDPITQPDDSSGLTQVFLFCKENGKMVEKVQSGRGSSGILGNELMCKTNERIVGFSLQVQAQQSSKDNLGATNMNALCSDTSILKGDAQTYGMKDLHWTETVSCSDKNMVVCAVKAKIDHYGIVSSVRKNSTNFAGKSDRYGLTNVAFECCSEIKK